MVRTLLVGDGPSDHRVRRRRPRVHHHGAPRPALERARRCAGAGDPQLTMPGAGRADVWVFDPANLGVLGGKPVAIVTCSATRRLAVAPDGATVYAAVFNSG
jgi:hypothetical protein